MYTGGDVHGQGYFPRHIHSQPDIENPLASGQAQPERHRFHVVRDGKIMHKPDKHRQEEIIHQFLRLHRQ